MTTDALNLSKLAKYFSDEDATRELLEQMRWNGNPTCPHCGGLNPYKLTPRKPGAKTRKGLWKCSQCRKQFTVTVGTVFEDSRIPISKWLLAIHLLGSSKKGMSAHQIHRNLGISYKAAWFLMHRLRYAMRSGPLSTLLQGNRRSRRNLHRRSSAWTRQGDAVGCGVEQDARGAPRRARNGRCAGDGDAACDARQHPERLSTNMDTNATMMTDEANLYPGMVAKHETVTHRSGEYVRGNAHTNTVEGFFGLLKKGIEGVYHHVS